MGGGRHIRGDSTRLFAGGLAASVVMMVLGTAAATAHGFRAPVLSPPRLPALVRWTGPGPLPTEPPTTEPARPAKTPARPARKPAAPTTTLPATTTSVTQPAQPPPPPPPVLPEGKGMWVWEPVRSDGGSAAAMIARAKAVGLSHIFVRTGSSWDGFNGGPFLSQLLPAAHAAGIKVYGWDFPSLVDWPGDIRRAGTAIAFRTPSGQSIDGFTADIETIHEGTHITPLGAQAYGTALRQMVGPSYLLVVAVPRPSPQINPIYPWDSVVGPFDAIAPMIYWLNRQPGPDAAVALDDLARFHKPLMPIGQAYDGGPEGGRPGVPPRAELLQFMDAAKRHGAAAISFWSWQAANPEAWDAIRDGPSFLRFGVKRRH